MFVRYHEHPYYQLKINVKEKRKGQLRMNSPDAQGTLDPRHRTKTSKT